MIGMAIASQHARLLRLTNGPYGDAPGSRGRHVQYRSFGAVARWMATSNAACAPEQCDVGSAQRQCPRRGVRIQRQWVRRQCRGHWAETKRAVDLECVRRKSLPQRCRQRDELCGDHREAGDERPVEYRAWPAADPWTLREEQHDDAHAERNDRPAVRAREGDEGPADEEEGDDGRSRTIRAPLRRSSSCTDGRNTANSSTYSWRNRPCSARRRCNAAGSAAPYRSRARPGGGVSFRRR